MSLVLITVFLEIGVRISDSIRDKGERNVFLKNKIKEIRPFVVFGDEYYESNNQDGTSIVSKHGKAYKLNKDNDTYRVVVFGGSTSENSHTYSKHGLHYPGILESTIKGLGYKIEVISLANSGWSSAHSLVTYYLDVIEWDPDMIIVSHNINDMTASYFPHPVPSYSNKYNNTFYKGGELKKRYTWPNIIFQNSHLYWVIKKNLRGLNDRYFSGKKREFIQSQTIKDINPIIERSFERNLQYFIDLSKKHGIKVMLGTQALNNNDNKYKVRKSYNDVVIWPSYETLITHHKRLNNIVRRTAVNNGVILVDNESSFNGEDKYFIDIVHMSKEGVIKLANNYREKLLEEIEKLHR